MPAQLRATRKKTAKPLVVSIGRSAVSIYPRPPERGRGPRWQVADFSSGKRRLVNFGSERDAKAEAARLCARMNAQDFDGAKLTQADRRDVSRATELVAPTGLDVAGACDLFARAHASLEGIALDVAAACGVLAECARLVGGFENVVKVCKEASARSNALRAPLDLRVAVETLLEAKVNSGKSARLVADLKSRLGRFAHDHPGRALGTFTSHEVQGWIDRLKGADGKPLSAVTRGNFRRLLAMLFEWHRRRGAIVSNPVSDVQVETTASREDVAFWTVDEARAVLDRIDDEARAALVLGLFAGLRTAEAVRLLWRDVDLANGQVSVRAAISKTASRRLAPIPDNARAWLAPLVGSPDEQVFAGHPTRFPKLVSEACERAGVRRIENAARHSFITYRVAQLGDVARVALDAGNSPAVVFKNYRGMTSPADAQRFFAITPSTSGKGVLRVVA